MAASLKLQSLKVRPGGYASRTLGRGRGRIAS